MSVRGGVLRMQLMVSRSPMAQYCSLPMWYNIHVYIGTPMLRWSFPLSLQLTGRNFSVHRKRLEWRIPNQVTFWSFYILTASFSFPASQTSLECQKKAAWTRSLVAHVSFLKRMAFLLACTLWWIHFRRVEPVQMYPRLDCPETVLLLHNIYF